LIQVWANKEVLEVLVDTEEMMIHNHVVGWVDSDVTLEEFHHHPWQVAGEVGKRLSSLP